MNYRFCASGVFKVVIAVFALALFLAPRASAETIGISSFTACGGGTTCIGGFAYSLLALEVGTQSISLTSSAVYQLDNDTGIDSFSLPVSVNLAFNESLNCQENGSFSGSPCTISGALGTFTGTYGPPAGLASGVWNPGATITFSGLPTCGPVADDCRFDLAVTAGVPTPEPSSLVLLATGLVALLGLAYRKS
jgi:PEP-CTERM motif-containing protein